MNEQIIKLRYRQIKISWLNEQINKWTNEQMNGKINKRMNKLIEIKLIIKKWRPKKYHIKKYVKNQFSNNRKLWI